MQPGVFPPGHALPENRAAAPRNPGKELRVQLDDVPGSLAKLSAEIAAVKANISIITHDRRSKSLPIGKTEVLVELETRGYDHIQEIIGYLGKVGYEIEVLK